MSSTEELNERFADLIKVFDYYKTLEPETLVPRKYKPQLLHDLMLLANDEGALQGAAQDFISKNLKPNNQNNEFVFIFRHAGRYYTTVKDDFELGLKSNNFRTLAGATLYANDELPYDEISRAESNYLGAKTPKVSVDETKDWLKRLAGFSRKLDVGVIDINELKQNKNTKDNERKSKDIKPKEVKPKEDKSKEIKSKNSLSALIKAKDYKGVSAALKNGINGYLNSDTFKSYLEFVSKFHKYSSNNNRLILEQNSNATRVASFNKWKELERKVTKGSKALYVYAPMQVIKKDENKKPILDENGKVQKDTFFKLVPVFDVSQTTGKELPKPIYELAGDINEPEKFKEYFKTLTNLTSAKVFLQTKEMLGASKGSYRPDENLILIKKGMGQEQTIKTLIHEIVHAELHTNSQAVFGGREYSQHEFEAESVAYIVASHLGIDTSEYSFGYLSSWTNGGLEIDSFQSSLEKITNEAKTLITKIDATLEKTMTKDKTENLFEERVNRAQAETKTAAVSVEKQQEKASPKV